MRTIGQYILLVFDIVRVRVRVRTSQDASLPVRNGVDVTSNTEFDFGIVIAVMTLLIIL